MYEDMLRRYPFFRSTPEERKALFGAPGRAPLVAASARQAQPWEERELV